MTVSKWRIQMTIPKWRYPTDLPFPQNDYVSCGPNEVVTGFGGSDQFMEFIVHLVCRNVTGGRRVTDDCQEVTISADQGHDPTPDVSTRSVYVGSQHLEALRSAVLIVPGGKKKMYHILKLNKILSMHHRHECNTASRRKSLGIFLSNWFSITIL